MRTRLPWLFLALAVASPPLWFWYVSWSIRDDYDGTGYAIGFFIFWPIVSFIFVVLFVALVALTWTPTSEGSRNLRRLILFFSGGTTLLVGLGIFMLYAFNTQDLGWGLIGIGVGMLFVGTGIMAGRELLLTRSDSKTPGGAEASR